MFDMKVKLWGRKETWGEDREGRKEEGMSVDKGKAYNAF